MSDSGHDEVGQTVTASYSEVTFIASRAGSFKTSLWEKSKTAAGIYLVWFREKKVYKESDLDVSAQTNDENR